MGHFTSLQRREGRRRSGGAQESTQLHLILGQLLQLLHTKRELAPATCRAPVVLQVLPRGAVAEVGDKHAGAVGHTGRASTAAAAAAVRALVTVIVSEYHHRKRARGKRCRRRAATCATVASAFQLAPRATANRVKYVSGGGEAEVR
jgi:hypothetical protein